MNFDFVDDFKSLYEKLRLVIEPVKYIKEAFEKQQILNEKP